MRRPCSGMLMVLYLVIPLRRMKISISMLVEGSLRSMGIRVFRVWILWRRRLFRAASMGLVAWGVRMGETERVRRVELVGGGSGFEGELN